MEDIADTTVTSTTTEQVTPVGSVVQHNVTTKGDSGEFLLRKINDVIWLFIGLIMLLLVIRIIFLLLGANNVGIVSGIYQLSEVFIIPFRGIFQSPAYGSSFFDMAAVVGLIFYAILGFIITSVLSLFSKRA